jgi:hypothetical protein
MTNIYEYGTSVAVRPLLTLSIAKKNRFNHVTRLEAHLKNGPSLVCFLIL